MFSDWTGLKQELEQIQKYSRAAWLSMFGGDLDWQMPQPITARCGGGRLPSSPDRWSVTAAVVCSLSISVWRAAGLGRSVNTLLTLTFPFTALTWDLRPETWAAPGRFRGTGGSVLCLWTKMKNCRFEMDPELIGPDQCQIKCNLIYLQTV